MVQRVLVKLDVMKRYEKKRLSKYELIECRRLGRVQLNPCVRTPLTFDFKLDCEVSKPVRSSVAVTPSTQHVIKDGQSMVQYPESTFRPQSESSMQFTRKDHSSKSAVRPFSAPNYLKHKPSNQRGNLKALDGGFMLLKLNQRPKSAHSTTEVQKRRERLSEEESKTLGSIDDYHSGSPTGTSSRDGLTTVTEEKGIYDEARNKADQDLRRESKVQFCTHYQLLQDDLNGRDTLLKDYLTNEGERIKKRFTPSKDALLKEKIFIPLCIEDEIEKPNAKVIRAGRPKPKCLNPVKASESFPIFCHNEGYVNKFVLNKWLSIYGDKAFYDLNKRGEVCMHLNPVLQNNYNESIAIIGGKKHSLPNMTAKRKKKTTLSGKPKCIAIQILSVKRASCDIPAHSQKETSFIQKMSGNVTKTISRHIVTERNISQNKPQRQKDIPTVYGENPRRGIYPNVSSRSLISGIKSQLPDFFEKALTSVEEGHKKGRVIYVDYIPISKPIPIPVSGGEFFGRHNSTHSTHNSCPIHNCAKIKPTERNNSEVHHQDALDKKPFLDENRAGGMEFSPQHLQSLILDGNERSNRPLSLVSLKGFQAEVNNSLGPHKSGKVATRSEEQHIMSIHSPVISIPTAEFDASEPHRDQSMKKPDDT